MYNSNSSGLAAFFILFFCLRYFLLLAQKDDVMHFHKLPNFWIALAFMFYCSSSVLILSSYNFLVTYLELGSINAWNFVIVFNFIRYLFLTLAGLCYYRQTYLESSS
jgi:hypothetical protein